MLSRRKQEQWIPCHLTGDRAAVFSNMECLRRPEEAWDPVVPACHRVSPADESGLMRRLLESGMVVLVEESKLPQDSKGSFLPRWPFLCEQEL